MSTLDPVTAVLLAGLDEAFDRRSWHGTNLRGALRGLRLDELTWRPTPARHNVWETAVHAAYWKYAVRRRLTGERRGSFPLRGSNWWTRPSAEPAWPADLALLVAEHRDLRAAVAAFPGRAWTQRVPGRPFTYAGLVRGAAAHDLYHAGQIQLLKRLARDAASASARRRGR
jgi:hypothetical protein